MNHRKGIEKHEGSPATGTHLRTLIGLIWLIGFLVFFSSFDLPNNRPATRWDIWQATPLQLLEIVWPLPEPNAPPSGWQFLPQRLPAIGIALAILGAAIGMGTSILKTVGLPAELTHAERLYFAGGIGLSLWTLLTLGIGLAGGLHPGIFWCLVIAGNLLAVWTWRSVRKEPGPQAESSPKSRWLMAGVLAICVPIVWAMLLGALTPQVDFDVQAYHLNGPKEWFQQGRITFLSHNVYTSFPFLTEMLLLSGMVLRNDVWQGALAGQAVLMVFAPWTALGLWCAGRRWFSETAGWLAVLIFLTTPWTYRISTIAYTEGGLSFFLFAGFFAAAIGCTKSSPNSLLFCLAGFLAGSGMACKYPGLTSAVIPIGLGILIVQLAKRTSPRSLITVALAYSLGVAIAIGPWLLKNLIETGNPVYPLAYSLFGGRDIDPELNAKWMHGHATPRYATLGDFFRNFVAKLADVVANNDWHSPLLYGLAPLSWAWVARRKLVTVTWLLIGWLFLTWFLLTHHIDRFWVPMIPVVALLSGVGAATFSRRSSQWIGGTVIVAVIGFNLTIMSMVSSYNAGLTDLKHAEQVAARALTPELAWLNDEYVQHRLPEKFKLLCEGEALTFHATFPVVYHSVFDRCLLEEWCAAGLGPEYPLKSAEEIRQKFRDEGITHLFVNWRWIITYREPGNYGFTNFMHPDRIRQLQELGILGPALSLPPGFGYDKLTDERQQQLSDWAPALIVTRNGEPAYLSGQIFPVLNTD